MRNFSLPGKTGYSREGGEKRKYRDIVDASERARERASARSRDRYKSFSVDNFAANRRETVAAAMAELTTTARAFILL